MLHFQLMDEIRRQIQKIFQCHGAAPEYQPLESILVRDGYYCGRRFEFDGMQAIWFIEENEIKFYGRDGLVQQVLRPQENTTAAEDSATGRRAA